MGMYRALVGVIPLFFLTVGVASAATGVLEPTGGSQPIAGTLLILVGLTLLASLWLAGWWNDDGRASE